MLGTIDFSQTAKAAHLGIQLGVLPVTDLARWKAAHSRPLVIDYCRWNEAIETTLRANTEAVFTLMFLWPRILLRTMMGV